MSAADPKSTADLFQWLLFGHLAGVVVLGAGLGTFVVGLHRLASAGSAAEMRPVRPVLVLGERTSLGGYGLLIATGLGLALKADAFDDAWLITSLVLLALLAALGRFVGVRLARVYERLDSPDGDGAELLGLARSRVVHLPVDVSVLLVGELVYLMTLRPGVLGIVLSLLVVVAVAAGSAWALGRSPSETRDPTQRDASERRTT